MIWLHDNLAARSSYYQKLIIRWIIQRIRTLQLQSITLPHFSSSLRHKFETRRERIKQRKHKQAEICVKLFIWYKFEAMRVSNQAMKSKACKICVKLFIRT
nr:PREDICTED: uncharacterized protein LOC108212662 [Daucus carota subsp. sativus]